MKVDINKILISVSIPTDDVEKVRNAVCNAGAGIIGNYSFCTSSVKSVGTFIPNDNAHPHIGSKNTMEYVLEEKMEFVCETEKAKEVLKALRNAHPYEEPAINIIPLIDEKSL